MTISSLCVCNYVTNLRLRDPKFDSNLNQDCLLSNRALGQLQRS